MKTKDLKDCETNERQKYKKKPSSSVKSTRDLSPASKHENFFCNANGAPNYWILNALCS